jgi:uncharacterized protein (DUF4415 family)
VTRRRTTTRDLGGRPPIGRAPRKPIAIRIDPDVLAALRAEADAAGIGYQSLINDVLARHARKGGAK